MAHAYIGTFTTWDEQPSEGIYGFSLDAESGALEPVEVTPLADPSFVAVSPARGVLYAATHSSHFEDEPGAGLVAYRIDGASGRLTRLGSARIPSTHPANVKLDRSECFVLTACGLGGATCVFPIADDGSPRAASSVAQLEGPLSVPLGMRSQLPHPPPPGAPHPHCAIATPDNGYVLVANMNRNGIHIYRFDAQLGTLTPASPAWQPSPPGVVSEVGIGARHIDFHPSRSVAYVNNERHSSVSVFAWDADAGVLEHLQTISTVPASFDGQNATADVHVHPAGELLFVSNRGHDSIASFGIDADGLLEPIGYQAVGGSQPRNFAFSPDARLMLVANQASGTIIPFRVDAGTGALEPTGAVTSVPCPVCIAFAD